MLIYAFFVTFIFMKRLLFFLLLLPVLVRADDTILLNSMCAAGNVTLTRNYSISGQINVIYQLHGAGFTISTSQTSGAALRVTSSGAQIDHVTIQGTWAYTGSPNPSGNSGIVVNAGANNVTIQYNHIENVSGYGINVSPVNNLNCTHNLIDKVGYIGFYFDAESNTTTGNTFSNNTVDKSMLNPATAIQIAVGIRGATHTAGDTTAHWTIANDTLKMPLNTTSTTECIEVRQCRNSTVNGLICTGGSIGISVIGSRSMVISNNRVSGNNNEAIEIGATHHSHTSANSVTSTLGIGYLIDGGVTPCYLDTLNNDTAHVTGHIGMQLYTNTHDVLVSGAVITHTTQGVYCQNTNHITIYHCSIDGGSHASTVGVYVNGGTGRVKMQRGGITHNTYAVYANNSTPSQVVDSLIGVSVNLTGTSVQFGSTFSNGAHYGSAVYFVSGGLTFGTIPSKVYGVSPFSPGATSLLPITYVTTGHHTSVVSGLVHISGAGIDTITASNGDTSAVQPLTVTKASLVITADSKTKVHGQVNPPLTASYGGLQYSDTPAVVGGVTLATTCLTGSSVGSYPITVSGATAANYTFVLVDGVLVVTGTGGQVVLHFRVTY